MRIPAEIREEIVAHSREEAPNECCGLLGGRDGEITSIHRARNVDASPLSYTVDSRDLFRITMELLPEAGEELVGIYHSHTKSPAWPSGTDVDRAEAWPDPLYLICSLARAEQPDLRAFAIRDGGIEEVELAVG
jgi:[CysO sulfur-carrier protein]-S-L-cysteine hydrolase